MNVGTKASGHPCRVSHCQPPFISTCGSASQLGFDANEATCAGLDASLTSILSLNEHDFLLQFLTPTGLDQVRVALPLGVLSAGGVPKLAYRLAGLGRRAVCDHQRTA